MNSHKLWQRLRLEATSVLVIVLFWPWIHLLFVVLLYQRWRWTTSYRGLTLDAWSLLSYTNTPASLISIPLPLSLSGGDVQFPVCVNKDRALDILLYQEANHCRENLLRYQVKFSLWIIFFGVLRSNACLIMSSLTLISFDAEKGLLINKYIAQSCSCRLSVCIHLYTYSSGFLCLFTNTNHLNRCGILQCDYSSQTTWTKVKKSECYFRTKGSNSFLNS